MKSMHNHETDLLFDAILALESIEDCYLFFEDICSDPQDWRNIDTAKYFQLNTIRLEDD